VRISGPGTQLCRPIRQSIRFMYFMARSQRNLLGMFEPELKPALLTAAVI
jgi:hypothetical protein